MRSRRHRPQSALIDSSIDVVARAPPRRASPDRPSRRRRRIRSRSTSPGRISMPTSLVLMRARLRALRNAARSDAAGRRRRRGCRRRRGARRRRRCCRAPARRSPTTISSDAAGAAAVLPVAAGIRAGTRGVRKNSGKRTSVTSRLPNLMPPAACHSPAPGQPSPAGEAPPPGRAWNMCQMNGCLRARIRALDGDAEAPPPAGHRAIRAGRRQRLDDRLDDLLRRSGWCTASPARPRSPTPRCRAWRSPRAGGTCRRSSACADRSGRPAPPPPPSACWDRTN